MLNTSPLNVAQEGAPQADPPVRPLQQSGDIGQNHPRPGEPESFWVAHTFLFVCVVGEGGETRVGRIACTAIQFPPNVYNVFPSLQACMVFSRRLPDKDRDRDEPLTFCPVYRTYVR